MGDAQKTFGWLGGNAEALVAPHMEYMRKNRWVIDFAGMPAGIGGREAAAISLRLNCSKASRPKISFEETEVKRINGSIKLAGKPKYDDLSVTFYDSVKLDGAVAGTVAGAKLSGVPTASNVMEAWREMIYQPNRGDAFGSAANYKGFAYLHMLKPVALADSGEDGNAMETDAIEYGDNIAQTWLYQGIFPGDIQYGELDYGSSEVQEITVTFKYDRALRVRPGG